jgi:IS1 family transposase
MSLPKKNKIMILFLSPKNRWWSTILKTNREPKATEIRKITDVPATTLHYWQLGRAIQDDTVDKSLAKIEAQIKQRQYGPGVRDRLLSDLSDFRDMFFDPKRKEHLYTTARRFGMEISTAQQIIDDIIYDHWPVFPSLLYPADQTGREQARQRFEAYSGAYRMWMRRGQEWLLCGLRVRYTLKIRRGLVIRCKLNVPVINREPDYPPYWEYDGFLRVLSNKVFWMFEKRNYNHRGDYIHFITDIGEVLEERMTFIGTYLTTGQDTQQTIVSSDVMLRRLREVEVAKMEEEMHSMASIVRGTAAAEVERLLAELKAGRRRAGSSDVAE